MGQNDLTGYFNRGGDPSTIAHALVNARPVEDLFEVQEATSDRREELPRIPQQVFDILPKTLRDCAKFFREGHERDVFLTTALAVIAGAMPTVRGKNIDGARPLSIYTVIAANAGSGKGAMRYVRMLGAVLDDRLYEESRALHRAWSEAKTAGSNTTTGAGMQGETQPEPPIQSLFLAANSSARALADNLHANGGAGVIVESEIVTLTGALQQDWGNFIDILLKAFHGEPIAIDRKGGDSIRIAQPVLTLAISGTPVALKRLIPTTEDGLFSRMALYSFEDDPEWRSQRPKEDQNELDAVILCAAMRLDELHRTLKRRVDPLIVTWKVNQWNEHDRAFREAFTRTLVESHDVSLEASVKRAGVIAFRIGCILSVLRMFDEEYPSVVTPSTTIHGRDTASAITTAATMTVSDIDAEIGITLATIYLKHSLAIAKEMPKTTGARLNAKQTEFLQALPDGDFRRVDYKRAAEDAGIAERTARDYLTQFIRLGLVREYGYAKYHKVLPGNDGVSKNGEPANGESTNGGRGKEQADDVVTMGHSSGTDSGGGNADAKSANRAKSANLPDSRTPMNGSERLNGATNGDEEWEEGVI